MDNLNIYKMSYNLFDGTIVQGGVYDSGDLNYFTNRVRVLLSVTAGKTYTITSNKGVKNIYSYSGDWTDSNNKVGLIWTGNTYPTTSQFTVPTGATKVGISLANADSSNITPSDVVEPMLLEGEFVAATLPPYAPYNTIIWQALQPKIRANSVWVDSNNNPKKYDGGWS